jgi:hypothetical protein
MGIPGAVRVFVVVPVVDGPPQWSLLEVGTTAYGQQKLYDTTRAEAPVREVSVVADRLEEAAQEEHRRESDPVGPCGSDRDDGQSPQVDGDQRYQVEAMVEEGRG